MIKKVVHIVPLLTFLGCTYYAIHNYPGPAQPSKPPRAIVEHLEEKPKRLEKKVQRTEPDVILRFGRKDNLEKLGFYLPKDFGGCRQQKESLLLDYIGVAYKKYFDYMFNLGYENFCPNKLSPSFLGELSKNELLEIERGYRIGQLSPGDRVMFRPDFLPR
jgi:hypothetical protein